MVSSCQHCCSTATENILRRTIHDSLSKKYNVTHKLEKLNQCNNIQANCIHGKFGQNEIAIHWKE